MADCFLQYTVEAIACKMFDEAGPQERVNFCELIGVHDPITPRSIHIDEVDAFACISYRDFRATKDYRFSCRDTGNDSRVKTRPRVSNFPVRERSRDEHSHATS